MRVLDIDLDAFVSGTATIGVTRGQRLPEGEYVPWAASELRSFLEARCGLRRDCRKKGAVFEHHQEAFFYWKDLIAQGALRAPFDLVHVDAHSDMSTEGSGAHEYVLTELLRRPVSERVHILDTDRVTFANYPVFAAALGWLKSFVWVRPPTGDDGILQYYVGDRAIHLKCYPDGTFRRGAPDAWKREVPLSEDSPIPAEVVTTEEFVANDSFDIITICRSPQFTPASADALLELVREYIDEE